MSRDSVLIVDDEFGTVDALSAVLGDAGFSVATASNGRLALDQLRIATPSLVLLDYVLPVLDGCETLRAIRKDPKLKALPVVMMSGLPESMIRRKCKGYDAFLRKPFGLDELLACLKPFRVRSGGRK